VGWGYFLPSFILSLVLFRYIMFLDLHIESVHVQRDQIKNQEISFFFSSFYEYMYEYECFLSQKRCVRNIYGIVHMHMHRDLKLRSNTYSR